MRQFTVLSSILVLFPAAAGAQVSTFQAGKSCTYVGQSSGTIYGFSSDREARAAVTRIMDYTGLPPNFEIYAATVPNAMALIDSGQQGRRRVILYNQRFIDRLNAAASSDWAALSVLAHEIGHHLAGHTLESGGSRPPQELEADRFSGFVLAKMGATLDQAQLAMNRVGSEEGSDTHPPKSARLTAIYNGWKSANEGATQSGQTDPSKQQQPTRVPETTPQVNVSGVWQNGSARMQLTQVGQDVTMQETLLGLLPSAAGQGTITGRQLVMRVGLASGETLIVRFQLSADGQLLEGTVTNYLGINTPITYQRVRD